MKVCVVESCSRPAQTRGWCKSHYDAWLRTGNPASYRGDRTRLTLWQKITEIGWTPNEATGCLEWNGYRNELGYGQIRHGGRTGRLYRVHRVAYEHLVGPLSAAEHVIHSCDNAACSEPRHLRKGTALDNMHDMRTKRRGYKDDWTRCPNGHPYPADRPYKCDRNRCRECARARNRKYLARKELSLMSG